MNKKFMWQDLTVENTEEILEFYKNIFGWESKEHPMGDYNDYDMIDPNTGESVAGICHKRGFNENIPSVWMNYMEVKSVNETVNKILKLNGEVIDGPKDLGEGAMAIIKDPAGAVFTIMSKVK